MKESVKYIFAHKITFFNRESSMNSIFVRYIGLILIIISTTDGCVATVSNPPSSGYYNGYYTGYYGGATVISQPMMTNPILASPTIISSVIATPVITAPMTAVPTVINPISPLFIYNAPTASSLPLPTMPPANNHH